MKTKTVAAIILVGTIASMVQNDMFTIVHAGVVVLSAAVILFAKGAKP